METNKRIPRYRKLREDSMLDVKEPAWGDNLDPDSKNYIYDRSKTYSNTHKNPIKNFSGSRELAKALRYKKQLADGTVDQKKLAKDLEKEYKDLEKIKKKLGRDFKPEELTEMLLYLNDELRKAGINLRPDLMSKKDFLKAQEELETLLYQDYSDEEDELEEDDEWEEDAEWEDDEDFFEARKVSKRSRLKEASKPYTVFICDNYAAASRGTGEDTWYDFTVDAESADRAVYEAFLAKIAVDHKMDPANFDVAYVTILLKDDYNLDVDEQFIEDPSFFREWLQDYDPGFGDAVVYGIKDSSDELVFDNDYEYWNNLKENGDELEEDDEWEEKDDEWEDDEDFFESNRSSKRSLKEMILPDELETSISRKENSDEEEEEFVLWELDEGGYPAHAVASFLSLDRAKHYAQEVLRVDIIITKNTPEEDLSDYEYDPEDLVWTSPWIYN